MFVRYVLAGALTLTGLLSSPVSPFTPAAQAAGPAPGPQSERPAAHPDGEDAPGADGPRGTQPGADRTDALRDRAHHRRHGHHRAHHHAAVPGLDPAAGGEQALHADPTTPGVPPTDTGTTAPQPTAAQTDPQSTVTPSTPQPTTPQPSAPQPTAAQSTEPGRDNPAAAPARRIFQGAGFDTCQAPDLATMDAWLAHSDYRAAGVYFGGRARACSSQKNLTPDWVRRTTAAGWNLLPIYVGSQSPCVSGSNKNPYRIDPSAPGTQGASEGKDAVSAAQALGMKPGSALYLDMEAYDAGNASCAATTLAYVQAWDRQVHAAGYVTGFYSSADSGIRQMDGARRAGAADLPDVLWYARWGVAPNLVHEPSVADTAWTPHARIHQYSGAVTESYGGRSLSVDRNMVDAPVAVVG